MRRLPVWLSLAALAASAAAFSAPASAQDPFDPAEEHGFLRPESQQPNDEGASTNPGTVFRPRAAATADTLEGLFGVDEGQCDSGGVTAGSYFRMVQPGGSVEDGPFNANNDSPCGDTTYTPLSPGTDGGLSTSGYQPHPDPAFDAAGNGQNDKIIQPQGFFGVDFAGATNATDPQTSTDVPLPQIVNDAGSLSGDVRSFAAAWSTEHFNQGSPKPDGGNPGLTAGPTGTFDSATNAYALDWSSTIQGGPFNNFTGVWHLEGTFDGDVQVGTQAPAGGSGGGGSGTSGGGGEVQGAATGSGSGSSVQGNGPTPRTGPDTLPTVASGFGLIALAALGLRARRGWRRGN